MDPHRALEARVHVHIREQMIQEEETRPDTLWDISQKKGTPSLPGKYSAEFLAELRNTPFDWQISVEEGTILFLKTFPYESVFYEMQGWDAAYAAVNIDMGNKAVAFRILAEDQGAEEEGLATRINEGILVREGLITAFAQDIAFDWKYGFVIRGVLRQQAETKGLSGCTIDHLVPEFDRLPSLVRQLSGEIYGKFIAAYILSLESGKSFENAPKLNFKWPFEGHYLMEPSHHTSAQ